MRYEEDDTDTDTDDSKQFPKTVTVFERTVIILCGLIILSFVTAVLYVLFMFGSWLGGL